MKTVSVVNQAKKEGFIVKPSENGCFLTIKNKDREDCSLIVCPSGKDCLISFKDKYGSIWMSSIKMAMSFLKK